MAVVRLIPLLSTTNDQVVAEPCSGFFDLSLEHNSPAAGQEGLQEDVKHCPYMLNQAFYTGLQ